MKCFVFIFRPFFIADYSLVPSRAMIPTDLQCDVGQFCRFFVLCLEFHKSVTRKGAGNFYLVIYCF